MLIKMRVSNQLETLTTHPRREARLVSKESLCDSYGNLGFDGRVVRIGEEMKVLRREIEDALAVRDSTARQRNSREGQWPARPLFLRLFDVNGIALDVAEGVDKFPGRETDFVRDEARQQSIRCDVERYAQTIGRASRRERGCQYG